MTKIANLILRGLRAGTRDKAPRDHSAESPHILLGPVVQKPLDSADDAPEFYFTVTGGTEKTLLTICIGGAERDYPQEFRLGLLADLTSQRAIVIHDLDDEMEMARLAAAIWPCGETRRLAEAVRQERERTSGEARQ